MNKWKHSKKDKSNNGKHSAAPDPKSPDSSEESEFSFPILKIVDKTRNLYCYSAVLNRNSEDAILMEDLDRLQPELETMLSTVAVRMRTLETELVNFNSSEEIRIERKSTSSSARKRKLSDVRVSKSIKELTKVKDVTKVDGTSLSSENETDNSTDVTIDASAPAPETSKPTLPENVMPNKFWAFVEPYCGNITPESIKLLQEMVSSCGADMAGVKIPSLGEHYTVKWAKEDLAEEKDSSSSDKSKKKSGELSPDSKNILRSANYSLGSAKDRTSGPLVQRLVSALMEENYSNPLQENQINNKFDDEYFAKLPLFHTSASFERRLRKELEVIGLLEPNSEESDQILDDLKKCDEELKIVARRNKEYLSKILAQAEREMNRQNVRTKIKAIDAELLEIYKRVNSAKSKKKQLQPKEKDQAWRALKQREALFKSLESI